MKPPVFHSQRFTIQPYRTHDEDRFVEICLDKNVGEFMTGPSDDELEVRKLFHKGFEIYADENSKRWFWLWGVYEGDKLCGHLELKQSENTDEGELETVYMVHPDERNRGIMSEVLMSLRDNQHSWGRKIIATVNPENKFSLAILEKWGIERQESLKDPDDPNNEYLKIWLR